MLPVLKGASIMVNTENISMEVAKELAFTEEEIKQAVTSAYLKSFPALEGRFSVHFCRSADGVEI